MKMSDSLCKTADFADVVNPYCDSVCKGLKVDEKNGGSTCLSATLTDYQPLANEWGKKWGKINGNAQFWAFLFVLWKRKQARFTTHLQSK